jgi:hypothetical protein
MMFDKQNKNFWQGVVLIYTFAWLFIFISNISNQRFDRIREGEVFNPLLWLAIYAGGIGSMMSALQSLYQHCLIKRNFQPQFTLYYLVQPIFGAAEGVMAYAIFGVGILLVNSVLKAQILADSTAIILLMVLSWIAGFRQYPIVWIRRIVGKLYQTRAIGNQ